MEIVHRGNRYIHRDYDFIAAEIDAEAASGENIEIKTVSPFKAKEWGEIQTDAIPVHYTAQAMHGLMVTNKQVCVFGVLIGGDDFRIYRVERDEETIQAILEKEIAFWDRVKNLNPPEAASVSDVSLMFEKDAGTSIEADGKALALFNDLRDMKSRRKSLEEEIAISEEKLKMYMQEHSVLTLDGKPLCTWKSQISNRFDQKLFQSVHPELFEKFKTTTTQRVFRMK